MSASATELTVMESRISAIPREMGAALARMAFSPNIKERLDFSCALLDAEGGMLAQAAHIPVHLGAMPASVRSVLAAFPSLEPGDVVMLNDPFHGGSHLPDITMVSPLFVPGEERPVAMAATRAHHADVGGMTPGSLPDSRSIFQEGLRIPPVLLVKNGELQEGILDLLCANSRSPGERRGDVRAQIQAHHLGGRRFDGLITRIGGDEFRRWMQELDGYAERISASFLKGLPKGEWKAEDGLEGDVIIRGELRSDGDRLHFDFRESDPAMQGSLNTVHAVCESAVQYVYLCVMKLMQGLPPLHGAAFRSLHVLTRPGSVLDAGPPHAVAGGNVETSQRIVDVVLALWAQMLPGHLPAQSQGTMNNVTMGGAGKEEEPFAYYETLGGGGGAGPGHPGEHGMQVHMTNTLNTPVEALEFAYPLHVRSYSLRKGSGGEGKDKGGNGLIREWVAMGPVDVSLLTERRTKGPAGLEGGQPGKPGCQWIERRDGSRESLAPRGHWHLKSGEVLHIETPGGGGYGEVEQGPLACPAE